MDTSTPSSGGIPTPEDILLLNFSDQIQELTSQLIATLKSNMLVYDFSYKKDAYYLPVIDYVLAKFKEKGWKCMCNISLRNITFNYPLPNE